MRLRTKELLVRDFCEEDLDALHEIYADSEVMEYLGGPIENKVDTRDEMEGSCLGDAPTRFAVVESGSGKLIGEVTFLLHQEEDVKGECEIGWALAKDWWRKGLAQQLTEALLREAKRRGAKAVFLCCEEGQEGPIHIAEKFGMEYVGLEWGQLEYRKEL